MLIPYLLGSDPEAVFVGGGAIMPAQRVLGGRFVNAFIGTDGHPATAELRPRPTRHVMAHMLDVAHGVVRLAEAGATMGTELYASPYAYGEPLGGHIHLSLATKAYQWPRHPAGDDGIVTSVLATILGPLEAVVQPKTLTTLRANHVNLGEYRSHGIVPVPPIRGLASGLNVDVAMRQYEYRKPSTWLVHPMLALAYLMGAKLVFHNFATILASKWWHQPYTTDEKDALPLLVYRVEHLAHVADTSSLLDVVGWVVAHLGKIWGTGPRRGRVWVDEWQRWCPELPPLKPGTEEREEDIQ